MNEKYDLLDGCPDCFRRSRPPIGARVEGDAVMARYRCGCGAAWHTMWLVPLDALAGSVLAVLASPYNPVC